jgi:hypothetical protein
LHLTYEVKEYFPFVMDPLLLFFMLNACCLGEGFQI